LIIVLFARSAAQDDLIPLPTSESTADLDLTPMFITETPIVETTPIITDPLTLLTPLDSTTTILSWTAHPDAVMYRVIFSREGQTVLRVRVNPMMCVDGICTLDLTAHPRTVGLQRGIRYRWHVQAILPDQRVTSAASRIRLYSPVISLSSGCEIQPAPTFDPNPGIDPPVTYDVMSWRESQVVNPTCTPFPVLTATPTLTPTLAQGAYQLRIRFDGADHPHRIEKGVVSSEYAYSPPQSLRSERDGVDGDGRAVYKAEISLDLPEGAVVTAFSMRVAPFANGGGAVYFFDRPSSEVGAVPVVSYTGLTPGTWNGWCGQLNRPFDQLVISAHVSSALPVEIKTYLDEIVIDYDIVALTPTPNRSPVLSPLVPNCQTMTPAPTLTRTPTATLAPSLADFGIELEGTWTSAEQQEILAGAVEVGRALFAIGIGTNPVEAFRIVMQGQNGGVWRKIKFSRINFSTCSTIKLPDDPIFSGEIQCGFRFTITRYTIVHEFGHILVGRTTIRSVSLFFNMVEYPGGNGRPLIDEAGLFVMGHRRYDLQRGLGMGDWQRSDVIKDNGWGSAALWLEGQYFIYDFPLPPEPTPTAFPLRIPKIGPCGEGAPTMIVPTVSPFPFQQNPCTFPNWEATSSVGPVTEIEEAAADMFLNWVYWKTQNTAFLNTNWRFSGRDYCYPLGCIDVNLSGDVRARWMDETMLTLIANLN
jgi:hypothetical protein